MRKPRGWELQSVDQISLNSFELHTYHSIRKAAVPKGVVVRGIALPGARFQVDTDQGSFTFLVADLESGELLEFLEGRARVLGLLDVTRLTGNSQEDDYPTIAVSGDQAWAAWQSYHGDSDEIRVAKYEGRWRTFTRVPGTSGDVWRPQIAVSGKRVWVVWSQQVNGNFDIYARALNEGDQRVGSPDPPPALILTPILTSILRWTETANSGSCGRDFEEITRIFFCATTMARGGRLK